VAGPLERAGDRRFAINPPGKIDSMTTHESTTTVPYVDLNDGNRIPQLGFGVFLVPPDDTAAAVAHALRTGYRSIDTAAAYRNEAGVGEAVRSSGLAREDVFVTTKLANDQHGHDTALRAFEGSLARLGFDYVDLYLIHWPIPSRNLYVETWQALTEIKADGRARSIGVSNFLADHLQRIIDASGVVPAVNQIELHPYLQQTELRGYHDEHRIKTEAWSPLARGGELLREPTIEQIAASVDRSPAQVVLRWHIQLGNIVIPKSVTPARIEENFRLFDFELGDEQMRAIGELDRGIRTGPDPATFPGG
jgi:diketogulonate reductase-like aldo/keto reductase